MSGFDACFFWHIWIFDLIRQNENVQALACAVECKKCHVMRRFALGLGNKSINDRMVIDF